MKHAVIYCRVSSKKQVQEGHGLSSQEATCRQYAQEQGFTVARVFRDDYSGGGGDFWARPGIRALLEFLEGQEEEYAVIFDDIKRFARDTLFHLKLRQELAVRMAYPLCPTFRFEDSPEGEFVETVIAATAQLERQQNRRQVIRRMKARLEAGFWAFPAPLGYRFTRRQGQKLLIPDEPVAGVVREALENVAAGQLPTQRAVVRYLMHHNIRSGRGRDGTYSPSAIRRLLEHDIYCGWCTCQRWNVRVRGRHEPLITDSTHRQILARLEALRKTAAFPKTSRADFPLRGKVRCKHCDRAITPYWAQGRSQKYPYYRCGSSGCVNIRQEQIEKRFLERLWEAVPSPGAVDLFERVIVDAFGDRKPGRHTGKQARISRLAAIDEETARLVDALSRAPSEVVRRVYEEKIAALQAERESIEGKQNQFEPAFEVEPVLEKGRDILRDPHGTWQGGTLRKQRLVQNLVFEAPISFNREEGFRTAEFSLLFRLLAVSEQGESSLVDAVKAGLNPVAEEFRRWETLLEVGS